VIYCLSVFVCKSSSEMYSFTVLAILVLSASVYGADEEALRECANLHRIEIQHIPNAKGEFLNSKCTLKCSVGDQELSTDAINEGFACPTDPSGKCQKGQCVGGDAALVECGKLHHLDFKKLNNKGTEYSNSMCNLNCAIDGNVMSNNPVNENAACPGNSKGVCKKGQCVTDGSTPVDPVTTGPGQPTDGPGPVTPKPGGDTTEEPIGPTVPVATIFSQVKLDEVTFKVKPGKFNAEIERAYADVCLSDTQSLDNLCKQICYSNEDSGTSKEPKWDKNCAAMKTTDENYLYIAVYSKADEKFIGSVQESLNSLFAQHYKTNSADQVQFERQFPVQYFGTTVGHIGLDVTIKFSKK